MNSASSQGCQLPAAEHRVALKQKPDDCNTNGGTPCRWGADARLQLVHSLQLCPRAGRTRQKVSCIMGTWEGMRNYLTTTSQEDRRQVENGLAVPYKPHMASCSRRITGCSAKMWLQLQLKHGPCGLCGCVRGPQGTMTEPFPCTNQLTCFLNLFLAVMGWILCPWNPYVEVWIPRTSECDYLKIGSK